jgi:FkbM family methyltransferase
VLKYGYFEEEVLTSLLEHVGSNGVLWDIGANIGLHSITVKHLCPKVQVVSFEPSPFTFSRLYLNASLNHADLLLFNIGLGNSTGYPKLSLNISGNSGQTSFRPWGHVSYQHSMLCFCDTAANLVRNGTVPMPTVLKVDVEGFELEVISGFQEFLESRELNTIVFESRPDFIENSGCYPIYRLLRQAGFEISPLYSDNKDENSRPTNFIAKR